MDRYTVDDRSMMAKKKLNFFCGGSWVQILEQQSIERVEHTGKETKKQKSYCTWGYVCRFTAIQYCGYLTGKNPTLELEYAA